MIRVVNVRGLNNPHQREGIVYVGRAFAGWPAHPLGNPFRPHQGGMSPGRCLDRYRDWLLARPTLDMDLFALWMQTNGGKLPLGCWCTNATLGDGQPTICHAQILADLLARFLDPSE